MDAEYFSAVKGNDSLNAEFISRDEDEPLPAIISNLCLGQIV